MFTCPPKGLKNNTTYQPKYVNLSIVVDFSKSKFLNGENKIVVEFSKSKFLNGENKVVDFDVDYIHSYCQGIWLNINK